MFEWSQVAEMLLERDAASQARIIVSVLTSLVDRESSADLGEFVVDRQVI